VFESLGFLFDLKIVGAAAFAAYSFLFGVDGTAAMLALIALMVIDLITGTLAAAVPGGPGISSRRAAKTPLKFAVYLMLISSANLADSAIFEGLYIQKTMIAFLALTELISILENSGKLGFGIPKKLLKQLQIYRGGK